MEMSIKNSMAYIRHHMTRSEVNAYRKARLQKYIELCDEGGLPENLGNKAKWLEYHHKIKRLEKRIIQEDIYRKQH